MRGRNCTLAIIVAATLAHPIAAQSQWPTKSWPSTDPRAVGLDPKVIAAFDADVAAGKYGLKWWLYSYGKDGDRWAWGGSGFGGQRPIVVPDYDLVMVFTAWDILPGRTTLTTRVAIDRLVEAVVDQPAGATP